MHRQCGPGIREQQKTGPGSPRGPHLLCCCMPQDHGVEYKGDNSPLTKADTESNRIICEGLQRLSPHVPIISEETKAMPYSIRKVGRTPRQTDSSLQRRLGGAEQHDVGSSLATHLTCVQQLACWVQSGLGRCGLRAPVGCVCVHVVPCCVLCCVLLCQNYDFCWVIDPIDGTKEFVKRNGEFTVMIGLIQVRVCGGGVLRDMYARAGMQAGHARADCSSQPPLNQQSVACICMHALLLRPDSSSCCVGMATMHCRTRRLCWV